MSQKLIFFINLIFWVNLNSAQACICSNWAFNPKLSIENIQDTSLEFMTVEVIKIRKSKYRPFKKKSKATSYQKRLKAWYKKVTIKIITNYNSSIKKSEFKIATGWGIASCGFPFKEGQRYFITLSKSSKKCNLRWVTICRPNKLMKDAQEELELLKQEFQIDTTHNNRYTSMPASTRSGKFATCLRTG
jgi:ferredoxin-NADP reductase